MAYLNELIFLSHLCVVLLFLRYAFRFGYEALVALSVVQSIFANFFVMKSITLFGLTVTCSDVFAVGSMISLNLIQEFYSREKSQQTVKLNFIFLIFFAIMSIFHLAYIPDSQDIAQSAYFLILGPAPRIVLASAITTFVVQYLDVQIFALFARLLHKRSLSLRNFLSVVISQTLDTLLFTIIGLWGVVASVKDVFFMSLLIKCIVAACLAGSLNRLVRTGQRA